MALNEPKLIRYRNDGTALINPELFSKTQPTIKS